MASQIEITIDADGKVAIDAQGYTDGTCKADIDAILAALGTDADRRADKHIDRPRIACERNDNERQAR